MEEFKYFGHKKKTTTSQGGRGIFNTNLVHKYKLLLEIGIKKKVSG